MAFLRDRSIFCIPESILSNEDRYIIGGICMVTASLGFTGAALQLKSLRQFRNRQRRRPSPNPDIVFYLALSDLLACAGVFALAICLMVLEVPRTAESEENTATSIYTPKHYGIYVPIGSGIEVITLFGYLASYIWTLSYALDTCFQIYKIDCAMVVYHILAWAIPLELIVIIEAINWGLFPDTCERGNARMSRVLLSYAPVMAVILANPIIFAITYNKVKQQLRSSGSYTDAHRDALYTCRRKFMWMVVVFTICWLPNIISIMDFIITFGKDSDHKSNYLDMFWYVEAFVNPLQGIFNYFLYRRAFRVTATDTRPDPNVLPRVTRAPSLKHHTRDHLPARLTTNQTLQRITASTSSDQDEDTPLIRPSNNPPPPRYVYISRLLGE